MPQSRNPEAPGAGAPGPSKQEIRERVAYESERRVRLGVPAVAGGVLYLLGGITVSATLKALPTVGVLQGLAPALRGEANPAVSPGAAEVRFISHHAFGLVAGNVLQALAVLFLVLVLLFLLGTIRFRRPQTSSLAHPLVLGGGAVMVLVSIVHPAAQAVNANNFTAGHDFSTEAVNQALTHGALLEATQYLGLLGGLTLAAGTVIVMLGGSRTGILPRWMMMLGIFSALLAFTPFGLALGSAQQLIPSFWMVGIGILLMGRWPGGDPPAWAAGEARPWPSSADARAERAAAQAGKSRGGGKNAARVSAGSGQGPTSSKNGSGDAVPEPMQPPAREGSRRRRKRGSRR
ncbi:MAG TPA: hypothetical protein VNY52_02600 [Solirubrobacteraceae bacterium]|jgi:hypothetical protein|nr:hypothetical protein [Solirubrobacteraceae bacterium]